MINNRDGLQLSVVILGELEFPAGDDMTVQAEIIAEPVVLAHEPDFRVGSLLVQPSTRQIAGESDSETLEPRVMQVLVALHRAGGAIVTQEELVEGCWRGVVVGDNAIHRIISRIRHVAAGLGGDSFRVETIAKVGYRLIVEGAEATTVDIPSAVRAEAMESDVEAPIAPPQKFTRRTVAAGIVIVGTSSALAYTVWPSHSPYQPDPRARDLYNRAQILLKSWELGSIRQAIAFNKQAVELDPDYADAWGALAISYIHGLDGLTSEAKAAYPGLVRSAAERALALDPGQAEAHVALAIPYPHFRRWFDHERRLRPLVRRFPNYWYGNAQLGILMADVGRYEDAILSYRRAREIDPMAPISSGRLAHALQQAGHDQEADLVLDEALARWPEHVFLWVTRSSNYIEGRRYAEAIAFSRDATRRPIKLPEYLWQNNEAFALALATGEGGERLIARVRDEQIPKFGVQNAPFGWLTALGAVDLAFDALEAYYFGGTVAGTRIPPPNLLDKRPTGFPLLNSYVLEHREHPRFKALLERTGLEDYWRKSGTRPDFRKN